MNKKTEKDGLHLVFGCSKDNDLYGVFSDLGFNCPVFPTASEAIEQAEPGSVVLLLADGYPKATTSVEPALFDLAAEKRLRLFVEYPATVPEVGVGEPAKTVWERAVVNTDAFGDSLPRLRILGIQDCRFVPVSARDSLIVMARVAGFDTAIYGLPAQTFPILFKVPGRDLLVATTKLSCFVTGRYAPSYAWGTIWEVILKTLDPRTHWPAITWTPHVRPALGPKEKLPENFERKAFKSVVKWWYDARLLISPLRKEMIRKEKTIAYKIDEQLLDFSPMPGDEIPTGDGSLGVLEGFASGIRFDGSQVQRISIRGDCNAETAMVMSLDWAVNGNSKSRNVSGNLLNFVYSPSGMYGGVRGNPAHPAFGLGAWGIENFGLSLVTYGDDNARVLLSAMIASACLKTDRWDGYMLKNLLANLRITGTLGFTQGGSVTMTDLESKGWKWHYDSPFVHTCTMRESYMWACYLWAYRHTGYRPFFNKAKIGIRIMMAQRSYHPWLAGDDCARILLALSWLVALEDTPEHRGWLKAATDYLLDCQQPSGAIQERNHVRRVPEDGYGPPKSNEAYGTNEASLIQQNGDPGSDQLYTTGFALLGLHEAAAITGDPRLKTAEDKLAEFLCRIQTRSEKYPHLNGTWFRAFDYKQWEYWGSSADWGWGAWSIESGWGTAWISSILGLRSMRKSIWNLTSGSKIGKHLDSVQKLMSVNDGSPWTGTPWTWNPKTVINNST